MKLKDVKIRIADFKSLLEAASVNINNPRVLIEPKKSSPSYQPGKPTSVLLECSDTKTGGTQFQAAITLQRDKGEYCVIIGYRAQHTLNIHNVPVNPELL